MLAPQKLIIIDTGCANLSSVRMAIERLGVTAQVSKEAAVIRAADKLIRALDADLGRIKDKNARETIRTLEE